MRILLINRTFWPEPVSAALILSELSIDLGREHQVTVLAGPSNQLPRERKLLTPDRLGPVEIIRTWGTRFSKTRLLGRLVNLGTYFVLATVASLWLVNRPDLVIVNTDPPLQGLLGAWVKRRWRCKFVYYCWDIYPDIAIVTNKVRNRLLLWLLQYANEIAYASADQIVAIGDDMTKRLTAKGVAPEKIATISQWVDCDRFSSARNELEFDDGGKFVISYFGNFGITQPLDEVLEAAGQLRHDSRFFFMFIGDGVNKAHLEGRARSMQLENVRFLPYPPLESSVPLLSAPDLHVIALRAGMAGLQVPYKVYGILAAGRPFVAIMEEGAEVAQIARKYGVGFVVPPGQVDQLVKVIRDGLANPERLKLMGQRGRYLAKKRFDREIVTHRFSELLASLQQ